MSFQTSCMVLVRDEQQQIKLEKWVKGIGRQIIGGRQDWSNFFLADTDQTCFWLQLDENDLGLFDQDFYNCDENIEMVQGTGGHEQRQRPRAMVRRSRRHPLRKAERYRTD